MYKQILKITLVIIGALIGAGFASGQEIYLFFFSYGLKGMLGIVISSILFGLVIYKVFMIIIEYNIQNYKQFLETIIGTNTKLKKRVIDVINIVVNAFILATFFIMIAGFGTYLSEKFHIPQILGSSILAVLCIMILSKEVKGLLKLSEAIVPALMLFILIIGCITIRNTNILNLKDYLITKQSNWFISSIIYTSYNMILIIPILISLKNVITKKGVTSIAILVGIITNILAICVYVTMVGITNIESLEMPISYAISTKFPYLQIVYGIMILSSILTTAISLGTGFIQNLQTSQKTRRKVLIAICGVSIPISTIGFSNLIQGLYPVFGYIGLLQILKIITVKTVEKT